MAGAICLSLPYLPLQRERSCSNEVKKIKGKLHACPLCVPKLQARHSFTLLALALR